MRHFALACALFLPLLAACGGKSEDPPPASGGAKAPAPVAKPTLDASSPRALAESIFAIAKDGDLALLAPVSDPVDADGDSKDVAGVAKAPADKQATFRTFFRDGKVSGEVKVEGDRAEVPILFGPGATKKESFRMVRRDGRWYLQSF
jgi:hypothetical protein